MRDRNKNKKISLNDFISYHDDKMKGEERNAFERELQKDPFAKEASEGFASVTPQEANEDIHDLQKNLRKRVVRRQKFIIYRIAATIGVLMVVSSIFIIVERDRSREQISSRTEQAESLEITKSGPVTEPTTKKESPEKPVMIAENKPERSVVQQNKQEPAKVFIPAENKKIAVYQRSDSLAEIKVKLADEYLRSEQVAAAQENIKSDTSLMALKEIVVTAYGVGRAESEDEVNQEGYVPPQPAGGTSGFDKYIRENIQWPDTSYSGQKAVVVLSFSVKTDGRVDSIKIIRSPGIAFSEEAIRLIRTGPAWKPAEDNGKPVEDQVRVRVVFK